MLNSKVKQMIWKLLVFIALYPLMFYVMWDIIVIKSASPPDFLIRVILFSMFAGFWAWVATDIFKWAFSSPKDEDGLVEAILSSNKIKGQQWEGR